MRRRLRTEGEDYGQRGQRSASKTTDREGAREGYITNTNPGGQKNKIKGVQQKLYYI